MEVVKTFSDSELISSLKWGRQADAIQYLYQQHFDFLSKYVLDNNGSLQDAEDNFQDVLVNFISLVHQDKFRGESSVKTFLYSMNRFTWLNELKRKGRANVREKKYEMEKPEIDLDVSQQIIQKETTNQLTQLMQNLGETCKKILLMFYYESLPMKDILLQLNYENEQVVRNKKYKCLKQLEKMIAEKPALKTILKNMANG